MLDGKKIALSAGLFICSAIGATHAGDFWHANWTVDARFLNCPKILKGNEALILTLGEEHGSELAIEYANEGERYYLISHSPPDDHKKPLMTPEKFALVRSLKIPAAIRWLNYDWDIRSRKEKVFAKSGSYIVYTSDNLEAGAGGHTCSFQYIK